MEQRRATLAEEANEEWELSTETAIYIYLGLTLGLIVLSISRSIAFFNVCINASVKLHDTMFDSLINTSMRFFNDNCSGRILNRFSKDMGAIDERLPVAMIDCTQTGLSTIAIIVIIASVDIWLLIPVLVIGVIFYFLRVFYMRTCRAVKRLEGVSKYIAKKNEQINRIYRFNFI